MLLYFYPTSSPILVLNSATFQRCHFTDYLNLSILELDGVQLGTLDSPCHIHGLDNSDDKLIRM